MRRPRRAVVVDDQRLLADAQVVEAWVLLAPLRERAFAEDGLHLSGTGYDVLLPALREAVAAVL